MHLFTGPYQVPTPAIEPLIGLIVAKTGYLLMPYVP